MFSIFILEKIKHNVLVNLASGSLPSVDDGIVSRQACLKQGPDCCSVHVDIEVKNCDGFFVYNLARIPDCYSVYCFGKRTLLSKLLFLFEYKTTTRKYVPFKLVETKQ